MLAKIYRVICHREAVPVLVDTLSHRKETRLRPNPNAPTHGELLIRPPTKNRLAHRTGSRGYISQIGSRADVKSRYLPCLSYRFKDWSLVALLCANVQLIRNGNGSFHMAKDKGRGRWTVDGGEVDGSKVWERHGSRKGVCESGLDWVRSGSDSDVVVLEVGDRYDSRHYPFAKCSFRQRWYVEVISWIANSLASSRISTNWFVWSLHVHRSVDHVPCTFCSWDRPSM